MFNSTPRGGPAASQQPNAGHFDEGLETVGYQHGQYPEHYNPPPTSEYQPGKGEGPPASAATGASDAKVLGMKKGVFLTVFGLITLVLVGLVIGLGAGLGTQLNKAKSTSEEASSSSTTATPTSTASPTATYTAASSTSTAAAVIPCPSQNQTLYTANSAIKTQLRLYCGVDFSGDEADDLGSVDTVSMESCMDVCASTDKCQGAGWGSIGTVSAAYTCYLKTNLTTGHNATKEWSFAVNLNNTDDSFVL